MDFPVIIVGGGPVGLASSLFLSRLQIRHLLIEKHPGTSRHPKAMGLQSRTMEIFRGIGVAPELEERALAEDWTKSILWCKSLFGEVLREIPITSAPNLAELTPMRALHCPQTITEEVLYKKVLQSTYADSRFHHEMTGLDQTENEVSIRVINWETGENLTFTSEYLIAADGASGSVRDLVGIERLGPPDMGHFANIYFQAEIGSNLLNRKAIIYNCLSTEDYGSVVAVNGQDKWLMHHFLMPGDTMEQYTPKYCRALISRIAGIEEAGITILGVSPWVMSAQISSPFRSSRVFVTGDAAHRTTPAGGLGLNTGIHSAHNLCWKLGTVLRGWCDSALLDTYDQERRSIVASNIEASKHRAGGIVSIVEAACTGKWEEAVAEIQQLPPSNNEVQRDLGYRYETGALSGIPLDAEEMAPVVGRRAPHVWLEDGRSILDLFGDAFVYLAAGPASLSMGNKLKGAARQGAVQVVALPESLFINAFRCKGSGAVLVRPDGFIGWRTENSPCEAEIPAILRDLMILKT